MRDAVAPDNHHFVSRFEHGLDAMPHSIAKAFADLLGKADSGREKITILIRVGSRWMPEEDFGVWSIDNFMADVD